jgi:hypothetical protein
MKINFDIDATPQELRTFFGLPNLEPLQNDMLEMVRKNMVTGVEGFDPATVMKLFLPEQMQTFSAMQKTFWQAMLGKTQDDKERA